MKKPDTNAGFTLLELIISLTIIAIIAMMVQNGFKLSVGAWEKGESAIESQQRYRYVLELIQEQISSAVPLPLTETAGADSDMTFRGDEASLEFVSRMSLVPGNPSGIVQVQYRVEAEDDGENVSYMEKSLLDRLRESSQEEPGEEDRHILLSDIHDFAFEYLAELPSQDALDDSFWESSWGESGERKGLPLALRVRFQPDEESSPLYLVVPVGKGK